MDLKTRLGTFSLMAVIGYIAMKVFRESLTFDIIDAVILSAFVIVGLVLLVKKK